MAILPLTHASLRESFEHMIFQNARKTSADRGAIVTRMTTPNEIYRRFIGFEEQAANIYLSMASRFASETPDLATFWLEMGMQEKQHAGLLQFCLAEKLIATSLPNDSDIREVEALFVKLSKEASNPALSVETSFKIAAEMEAAEVNVIYDKLTTPVHPSMYLCQRKIATLTDHIGVILQEARKFNVSRETLNELDHLSSSQPSH